LEFGSTLRGYEDAKDAVDGDFGENTFSAVVVFQRQNNLKETGEVDSETLKALNLKIQEKNEK
jgi:peptidoglycan hydrolase-like protein with peptidoglycan-binding domain